MAAKIRRIFPPSASSFSIPLSHGSGQQPINGYWNIGPSSDVLDMIWSFISPKAQLSVISLVCHRWNTANKTGNGWDNNSEDQPFDLNGWFTCDPLSSIVYRLLHDRWHHLTSLEV
jgi:hypothetical protein